MTMSEMWDWLGTRAAEREAAGLRRRLRTRELGDGLVDLAGNDYLGLSTHPEVRAAAAEAVWAWGAGSTGSRLVTGTTVEHTELERELADFLGAEAALVFSSGYLANLGLVTALAGPEDLLISDAQNHASVIDACRLSGARRIVVEHCSPVAVQRALDGTSIPYRRAFVLTESVFSVDGDVAPLAELAEVCRAHGAALLVDEAHGVGVHGEGGRGGAYAAGLAGAQDVVLTVTLSKSFGTQGGVVVGSRAVIDHLVDTARGFIFDTALAPSCAAAARAALRVLRREPELAERVRRTPCGCTGSRWTPACPPRPLRRRHLGDTGRSGPHCGRRGPLRGARGAGRLLPAAVGAGRPFPAAADRARGPDRG
jgi:8-amino-7-oxononanoate synthase